MAATVTYADELKDLAGVRAGGRRLEKPVGTTRCPGRLMSGPPRRPRW